MAMPNPKITLQSEYTSRLQRITARFLLFILRRVYLTKRSLSQMSPEERSDSARYTSSVYYLL